MTTHWTWTKWGLAALTVCALCVVTAGDEPWGPAQRMGPRARLGQDVLVLPQPPRVFAPGATLYVRSGSRSLTQDVQVPPGDRDRGVTFNWDVSRVPGAQAVLWQVSRCAFEPFAGGTEAEAKPHGLLVSGIGNGARGGVNVDFGRLADDLGLRMGRRLAQGPPPTPPPGPPPAVEPEPDRPTIRISPGGIDLRIDLGRGRREPPPPAEPAPPDRRDRRRLNPAEAFFDAGGSVIFYARAIPLSGPNAGAVVGMPSSVICVYYGQLPPPQEPARIEGAVGPRRVPTELRVAKFEYIPYRRYCRVHRNPADCAAFRGQAGGPQDLTGEVGGAWNWDDESYVAVRRTIVETVAAGLPTVPPEVLEAAVDSTWATAGIPPTMPGMDRVIDGGLDELAACAADQAGLPAALQGRALAEFKRGLRKAQRQAGDRMLNLPRGTPCQFVTDPPCALVTLRNASRFDCRDVQISVHDTGGVFDVLPQTLDRLSAGGQIVLPFVLARSDRLEYYDGPAFSGRKWWDACRNREMQLVVEVSTGGPGARQDTTLYASPTRKWGDQAYSQDQR